MALAIVATFIACVNAGPTVPRASGDSVGDATAGLSFDQPFAVRAGESRRVGPEGLEVRFERVASDSRCPINVTCVWEGDGVVVVTARQLPLAAASLELHTQPSFPVEADYGSVRVRLLALAPQPREHAPPAQADYVATLVVVRR